MLNEYGHEDLTMPETQKELRTELNAEKKQKKEEEKKVAAQAAQIEKAAKKAEQKKKKKKSTTYCWCGRTSKKANAEPMMACSVGSTCNGWIHQVCEKVTGDKKQAKKRNWQHIPHQSTYVCSMCEAEKDDEEDEELTSEAELALGAGELGSGAEELASEDEELVGGDEELVGGAEELAESECIGPLRDYLLNEDGEGQPISCYNCGAVSTQPQYITTTEPVRMHKKRKRNSQRFLSTGDDWMCQSCLSSSEEIQEEEMICKRCERAPDFFFQNTLLCHQCITTATCVCSNRDSGSRIGVRYESGLMYFICEKCANVDMSITFSPDEYYPIEDCHISEAELRYVCDVMPPTLRQVNFSTLFTSNTDLEGTVLQPDEFERRVQHDLQERKKNNKFWYCSSDASPSRKRKEAEKTPRLKKAVTKNKGTRKRLPESIPGEQTKPSKRATRQALRSLSASEVNQR